MRRISIAELNASAEELTNLRAMLAGGGVAAIPTETFYGLATNPKSEGGVRRIVEAKGRDDSKAMPVLFGTRDQLEHLGIAASAELLDRYFGIWPAPLTVVLPIREPIAASRGGSTLGVRLPAARKLRALLQAVGPLTGTSLNRSGSPPLEDPDAVEALFGRELNLLVDGGKTPGGKPSTLVDATRDPPVVLRAGAFDFQVISPKPKSPG